MGVVRPNAQCGIACVQDLACGQALAQVTYVTVATSRKKTTASWSEQQRSKCRNSTKNNAS